MFAGKNLSTIEMKNGVRTCGFSYSGNMIMFTTDKTMGKNCEIHIFDARDPNQMSKYFELNKGGYSAIEGSNIILPSVFNTSLGTLQMLLNDKFMFDRYYYINSTKHCKSEENIGALYFIT